jgi:Fur family transcriptional regulator, iron response regulator
VRLLGSAQIQPPPEQNEMIDPYDLSKVAAEPAPESSDPFTELFGESGVGDKLRVAGIPLTLQRLAIAQVMLAGPVHLTAEDVLLRVRGVMPEISRATVYNTLKLFKEKGLVRDIIVPEHVVFDSTTRPHHHFYNVDTGEVTDVPAGELKIVGAASLPPDVEFEDIDVVVRVRRKRA